MMCPVCDQQIAPVGRHEFEIEFAGGTLVILTFHHVGGRRCELRSDDPAYDAFMARYR